MAHTNYGGIYFYSSNEYRYKASSMINKRVPTVQKALQGVEDGMTLMLGGFGLCGIPENSIAELVQKGTQNLTCISNNAGVDDFGLGLLLQKRQSLLAFWRIT